MLRTTLKTDPETSARMKRIRQANTKPELLVRKWLAAHGLRFRVKNRDLPGSPDIANRTKRWVVFVHGCFWHGHEGCAKATVPKSNTDFWIEKIARNKRRDRAKEAQLRESGFDVHVVWQCEADKLAKHEDVSDSWGEKLVSHLRRAPRILLEQ
jgi:DNA mismatch endonuclease Vsr